MEVAQRIHDADGWDQPLPSWDSPQTLVLLFASPSRSDHPAIDEVVAAYPQSCVVGCSTSGQILGETVVDDAIVVAVARFASTRLRLAVAPIDDASASAEVGRRLGEELAEHDLRSVFVLSDGLKVNGTPLSEALSQAVGSVVVTGGLAGDDDRFESTWVLAGSQRGPGRIAAVGLYGDALKVSSGSGGGWETFGVSRRITGSDGNVLHSLDDRPALELYKEYLGSRAAGLPATALLFPLALRDDDGSVRVRTVLAVDEATQSMTFAGDMPEGARVQLMRSDLEGLVDGAALASEQLHDSPAQTLMVAVSCVGRRLVLGEGVEEEVEATLEAHEGAVQVGFYSYGELSPAGGQSCQLHNQTMTLTAWSEG